MPYWRIILVQAFILLLPALIVGRLVYIQAFNHQYWRALAQGQQKFFVAWQGERGQIFFRDKANFAVNKSFDLVYAAPNEIENQKETAQTLSAILDLPEELILERISRPTFYELIKKKLTAEELKRLKELTLPGIYLGRELSRYYPLDALAAQTVGFLGGDAKGQYGIEGYYDNILRGKENILEKEKGLGGYFVNNFGLYTEKGADLVLTIDYHIQFMAEKLLKDAQENLGIEKGEIIVTSPNSGEILALANFPSFNLNQYSAISNLGVFKNSAFQELFEPGSVFKPITMAAAIEEGKITPQTTYVDDGFVKIGSYIIRNFGDRVWGQRSMTEVLEKSINTGSVFAQRQTGSELFLEYLERFGFFTPTGIDLQGEVFSQNKEFKKGYEINFATASFGQGIEVTSLQLVRAFSAVANGGKLLKPFVVQRILQNGSIKENGPQIQNSSVISESTASQLTSMLVSTVENGFSGRAKIEGYYIAGKTGTAQIPYEDRRGYYPDKTWQSFIGFAPALDAKFLILVKLHNPKTRTAESSAVPIFRELAKYIIDYWQIPPDYEPR
jgi:cell division protein FtsI/penicillin-binding protein 2